VIEPPQAYTRQLAFYIPWFLVREIWLCTGKRYA